MAFLRRSERPPLHEVGEQPDYRFTLANERTFLAWVRTSLAMLAGGVALHALAVPATAWVRTLLVVGLIGLGGVVCAFAYLRWARVERAMRRGEPLPSFGLGLAITGVLVVVAAALVIVLV